MWQIGKLFAISALQGIFNCYVLAGAFGTKYNLNINKLPVLPGCLTQKMQSIRLGI